MPLKILYQNPKYSIFAFEHHFKTTSLLKKVALKLEQPFFIMDVLTIVRTNGYISLDDENVIILSACTKIIANPRFYLYTRT